MNTRIAKSVVTVATFVCLILFASSALAKKPIKPTPEPEPDPCSDSVPFSPDHVFYRDTGKRKDPKITIYLAESWSGCEKALGDVTSPIDGESMTVRDLKFSLFGEPGDTFGRVVFRGYVTGMLYAVWGYDFTISGTEVNPADSARRILVENDNWHTSVLQIDLSPDTATLAFQLFKEDMVTEMHDYSIRMIDIEYCDSLPLPCLYDDERSVVIAETPPEVDFTNFVSRPTWGPLGSRIYFSSYDDFYRAIHFIELDEGWEYAEWPPTFISKDLYSSENQPEFRSMRRLASGIIGVEEYLAVEVPHEKINCGYIYFINVNNCDPENESSCVPELKFTGTNPSWTKDGKVIHHYYDPKQRACSVYGGNVGIYDDDSHNLDLLGEGYFPDGAGG